MLDLDVLCNLWILATIQILGMASAWLARLSQGSANQDRWQRLFFFSLLAVGGATMLSLRLPPACWCVSAVLFTLTILVVVCDFRRPEEVDPFASGF